MITRNKVVVISKKKRDFEYEGVWVIKDISQIEKVWKNNKTPIMMIENASGAIEKYPYIMLPDFIFDSEHLISFFHNNGIECGEHISNKKHNTAEDSCFLCAVGHHHDRNGRELNPLFIYNQYTSEINDVIIYETQNFFVKIEYGCMVKGMLMICPKEHILSVVQIPDNQMSEYKQIMRDIEFLLKEIYEEGTVVFFEHGSNLDGYSSHERSIVHAHIHVIWGVKFPQKYLDMVCLKEVDNIKSLSNTKYFSYQENSAGKLLAVSDPEVYVQRKFPRQVIGEIIGIPNEKTNWRREPFMENIIGTFDDFYLYLKSNRDFLCERIVDATDGFVHGYQLRKS